MRDGPVDPQPSEAGQRFIAKAYAPRNFGSPARVFLKETANTQPSRRLQPTLVTLGDTGESIGSVSFRMKASTDQYLMDFDGSAHYLRINAGTVTAYGFTDPTIDVDGSAATIVTNTDWHHIVVTTGTSFSGINLTPKKVNPNYFSGTLNEVRIFTGVLSADQAARSLRLDAAGSDPQ